MGFTIEDALVQTKELYHLKLLAGKEGCSNAISWVHMIEDTTIIQQLWGKELAITTGLGFQSHDSLFHFIEQLIQFHSVGLVINTGKYINDIPQDIIDYCNQNDFPLLTLPWEISLADLIKDFSMRCLSSEKEDRQISKYFKNIFMNPQLIEDTRRCLLDEFDVDGYFQVLLIRIENADQLDSIERRRVSFQLQLYFEKVESPYSFFWYDGYFVMIVNNMDDFALKELANNMYQRAKKRMKDRSIHIGIGTKILDFRKIILSYKRARAAVMMASQFHYPQIGFEDMGIYQILFSIEDQDILYEIYHRILDPLIEYDQKHHSELEETLYQYLLYDGNQQAMAKDLYIHRNTINYRMNKIKKILNQDISSFEDKIPYMLAFYIKKMIA